MTEQIYDSDHTRILDERREAKEFASAASFEQKREEKRNREYKLPSADDYPDYEPRKAYIYAHTASTGLLIKSVVHIEKTLEMLETPTELNIHIIKSVLTDFLKEFES